MSKNEEGVLVMEVLDGDTLLMEGKTRPRLRSVDTPELEYCGGKEAKEYLQKMVKGKRVVIKEQMIDQKGRPMGLVYLNDELINKEILNLGWGRFHSDNNSQREMLKTAYERAREKKLGIWSSTCHQTENTDKPECVIKGNIDKSTGEKIYYFPGCAQYEFTIVEKDIGEEWLCTEEEAFTAGFNKSETCP